MRYPSKRDLWLTIMVWLLAGWSLFISVFSAVQEELVQVTIAPLLVVVFLVWIWFGTYYEMREDYLLIRSGPIWQRIRYSRIKSMKKSSKPWSSAALSLKRIEIRHGRIGYTLISPADREAFLREMRRRCPNAQIEI